MRVIKLICNYIGNYEFEIIKTRVINQREGKMYSSNLLKLKNSFSLYNDNNREILFDSLILSLVFNTFLYVCLIKK